jgi:hypothetical protein
MRQILAGAVPVIAGIAAFIAAERHKPLILSPRLGPDFGGVAIHRGLSPTAYELLRIGAWALVVGGTLVLTGLIWYWGAQVRSRGALRVGGSGDRRASPPVPARAAASIYSCGHGGRVPLRFPPPDL